LKGDGLITSNNVIIGTWFNDGPPKTIKFVLEKLAWESVSKGAYDNIRKVKFEPPAKVYAGANDAGTHTIISIGKVTYSHVYVVVSALHSIDSNISFIKHRDYQVN